MIQALTPPKLDSDETLVILSSKSGGTKETLAVGEILRHLKCKTVVFTQSETSKLVKYGDQAFYTFDTPQSFHAMLMLLTAFLGGIWAERENWELLDELLPSLANLPGNLARAALLTQDRSQKFAEYYNKEGILHFVASGPMQFVSEAYGLCLVEEMIELDVNVYRADHFYHSFVEKFPLKTADRLVLLLGKDDSRWQVEQVVKFCAERGYPVEIYDAKDLEFKGIHREIEAMLAPILLEAALKPLADPLANKVGKNIDERKFMGKVGFWEGCEMIN